MPHNENTPLIGMISRIVDQKGYDLLVDALESLLEMDLQIVILGTGDTKLEDEIEKYQKKYPNKISLNRAFDETLAHMIEAGSDFFLMPSKFEPCGMNQIYSLRYGTFPIVFNTGGLADTITELNEKENTGNGFVFEKYTSKELIKVIKRATKLFKNKEKFSEHQLRIMEEDFSWDESMEKYSEVYDNVVGEE